LEAAPVYWTALAVAVFVGETYKVVELLPGKTPDEAGATVLTAVLVVIVTKEDVTGDAYTVLVALTVLVEEDVAVEVKVELGAVVAVSALRILLIALLTTLLSAESTAVPVLGAVVVGAVVDVALPT